MYSHDDPLSIAMRPPPEETDIERRVRVEQEAAAKRVSEKIDDQLRQEREIQRRKKQDVKLLLLGQSESGKSTLQKQFQMMHQPGTLESECTSWRIVIYFNVLRSVKKILDTLGKWGDADDETEGYADAHDENRSNARRSQHSLSQSTSSSPSPKPTSPSGDKSQYKTSIATLRLRLSPLIATDSQLADRLSGGIDVSGSGKGGVFVRSGWQARALEGAQQAKWAKRKQGGYDTGISPPGDGMDQLVEDVAQMLYASRKDVVDLWDHPLVKSLVASRKLRLDEWADYFLKSIPRIAARNYLPTTDDILHARIQTMGIAEHFFESNVNGKAVAWHLFDVGGARGQRHTWVPYFDDANAIIYMAPVSAFDQYLDEDPETNRIDDSLQLFTQICSNELLQNVHLVLFLNKTDLLKRKIERGQKVQKYITSYGSRPNNFDNVIDYFRAHFMQTHKKHNHSRRALYTHLTSVVDTKSTQDIIANVRDSIFRGYLKSAHLV